MTGAPPSTTTPPADRPTADARRVAGALLAALAAAAALAALLTRAPVATPIPTPSIALRIDINTATAQQLALLPDIGPARAAAIIAHRESHGPFRSLDDLDRVPGIGPRTMQGLAPLITTDAP